MDESTSKTCSRCKTTKPLEDFHRESRSRDGRRAECRQCVNRRNFAKWTARRDAQNEAKRRARAAASGGITKTCRSCSRTLPVLEFYRLSKSPDGRQSNCRDCFIANRTKRREMSSEEKAREALLLAERVEKTCTACNRTLPRAAFNATPRSRDGMVSNCKDCQSAWQKRHYEKNRAEILEACRRRYWANPQAKLDGNREWSRSNRERRNELARAWYEANRERAAAKRREWLAQNPGYMAEYMRQRRVKMAGGRVTSADLVALWDGLCGICGRDLDPGLTYPDSMSKSIDHIIPVARGGDHVPENLQWAHLVCNKRKGAKLDFTPDY